MTKPANVLVLDEPTNDLDSETLELLEEQVSQFSGTVLLVSHDRTFLNNVVTSTIVFEPDGAHEYDGGYDDWQRVATTKPPAAPKNLAPAQAPRATTSDADSTAPDPPAQPTQKLSYKDQRELAQLPAQIERLETDQHALATALLHQGEGLVVVGHIDGRLRDPTDAQRYQGPHQLFRFFETRGEIIVDEEEHLSPAAGLLHFVNDLTNIAVAMRRVEERLNGTEVAFEATAAGELDQPNWQIPLALENGPIGSRG
jgi:hypothetical protein